MSATKIRPEVRHYRKETAQMHLDERQSEKRRGIFYGRRRADDSSLETDRRSETEELNRQ